MDLALSVLRHTFPDPAAYSNSKYSISWIAISSDYPCRPFLLQYTLGKEHGRATFLDTFQHYWSTVGNCPCTDVPILYQSFIFDLFRVYSEVVTVRGGFSQV